MPRHGGHAGPRPSERPLQKSMASRDTDAALKHGTLLKRSHAKGASPTGRGGKERNDYSHTNSILYN